MSVAFERSDSAASTTLGTLYRFIARLTTSELDDAVLEALRPPVVRDILARCDPGVLEVLDAPPTNQWRQAADEAFAAAFLLPGGAPPRAAAWWDDRDDLTLERLTSGVTAQMRRLGLERRFDAQAGRLPLDHLALMLEVAATGLEREPAMTSAWVELHVNSWAARWGRALAERSTHPIYRALGVLCGSLFESSRPEPSPAGN